MHVEVRGQICGVSALLSSLRGSWGWNSGLRAYVASALYLVSHLTSLELLFLLHGSLAFSQHNSINILFFLINSWNQRGQEHYFVK